MVSNISDVIPSYLSKYSSLNSFEMFARSTIIEDSSIFSFFVFLINSIIDVYGLNCHIVKILRSFTVLYIIYYITKDRPLFIWDNVFSTLLVLLTINSL